MAELRVVVVGCGAVFERIHAPALARLRSLVRLVAVVEPDDASSRRAIDWFPDARRFGSLAEALATGTVDAAVVLSPPGTHTDAIAEAAKAGIPVLCEKPLAQEYREAERLALSLPRPDLVRVAMLRRHFDTYALLRHHLPALADTDDFRIAYREGGPYRWPVRSVAQFERLRARHGVLLDVGTHIIDLIVALFGRVIPRSYADNSTTSSVDTEATLKLEMRGGEASIHVSWTAPMANGWLIESVRGQIWIPLGPESHIFYRGPSEILWRSIGVRSLPGTSLLHALRGSRCSSYTEAAEHQLRLFAVGDADRLASLHSALEVSRTISSAYALQQSTL